MMTKPNVSDILVAIRLDYQVVIVVEYAIEGPYIKGSRKSGEIQGSGEGNWWDSERKWKNESRSRMRHVWSPTIRLTGITVTGGIGLT